MIIKANTRSGAQSLANHLLSDENEHVEVHHIKGVMAEDVSGAFSEIQAVARGTKCQKPFFSVSLSPPQHEDVPDSAFEDAAARIEDKLGLHGQPYVMVFHEKQGRRHAHCVWSRIDTTDMKAIRLDYYKEKTNAIAKDLYIEHGWQLPKGFIYKNQRDKLAYNQAEAEQAKRHRLNPKQIKAKITQCWQTSDTRTSLQNALTAEGFTLAKGDRRGFVVVDAQGEIYALARAANVKAKDIKARLGAPDGLPSVDEVKVQNKQSQHVDYDAQRKKLERQHKAERAPLEQRRKAMIKAHKTARENLKQTHTQRQIEEQQTRQAQYKKGLHGLWHWVTGRYHKQKRLHEQQYQDSLKRDAQEKHTLIAAQLKERQALQNQINPTLKRQQKENLALNASVHRQQNEIEIGKKVEHVKHKSIEVEI